MNVDVNHNHVAKDMTVQSRHHQNAINVNLSNQLMIHVDAYL